MDAAGTRWDRPGFHNWVLQVAAGLRQGGVHPGDRVALWLPNGTDYLAAIFACARLGRLLSISNTRFRMAEVGSLLRRSRASPW
jgi:fatty-acyl-CoA synthase